MTASAPQAAPVRDEQLAAIVRIAEAAEAPALAAEARAVAEQLEEGRFFVAVLGQFKRGKSTLINALAGTQLLPVGVAPVTSVVTIVRYGARPTARVRSRDGRWREAELQQLQQYVSEAGNPGNERGIVAVEVETGSSLLERGLCLVDTPGLGSVNAANTQETRDFLPHVDAAILVVGADPPITGEEARLLAGLGASVRDLFVVIAKADRVSSHDLDEARAFTSDVLAKTLPGRAVPVFTISAHEVLAADRPSAPSFGGTARSGDAGPCGLPTRDWTRLQTALSELALGAGATLVQAARRREVAALTAVLRRHLDENHGALLRPVAETERRIAKLRRAADEAERALVELRHLFDAEQKQIERRLEAERATFVTAALPELAAELPTAETRAEVLGAAQQICEHRVRAWRDALAPRVEAEFSAAAQRFATAAEQVTAKVRASSNDTELPESLDLDTSLCVPSRFFFAPLNVEAFPHWWAKAADRLRSRAARERAVRERGEAFLNRVLEANAHGVVGDYVYRIVESRRGIERAVREALRGAADAAVAASLRAELLRARGQDAVAEEVSRLVGLREELGHVTS